jgi:teichuronic acid biosynthesis glycosyltransferase TuaC
MRVLFVARWYPSHDSPGRGSFVADQVRALSAAGVDVVVASWESAIARSPDVVAPASAAWAAAIRASGPLLATPVRWGAGVPVARLPAVVPGDPLARHPVTLAKLQAETLIPFGTALAATWPFDLIHAHTGLPDGRAAADLADRLGLPLVTTEHDGSLDVRLADDQAREAYATLIGERRRLVAVSARLADQMTELGGLPRGSIDVIPNLVDLGLFRVDVTIARRPEELLWVGNRKASKGMEALLRAFALVARSRPDARLRLIGQAPAAEDERTLRGLAAELGIAERVAFEEPIDRAGVAAAMARADLFVHPSPNESFGVVAVEALASGLPVVAVAPTVVDLIGHDGRLGEPSEGPDAESLAAAISRALVRRPDFVADDLAAAARPYASDAVARRILALYGDTAPGAQRSGPPRAGTAWPIAGLIVAARRRVARDQVGRLDRQAAATLVVVTTAGSDGGAPLPVGTWVEADTEADFRAGLQRLGLAGDRPLRQTRLQRWLDFARHPRRGIGRRRLFAFRARMAAATFASQVAQTHGRLGSNVPIVALEADDVVAIRDAGLAVHLVPAGLRWIADRHDEASAEGRPAI